MKKLVVSAAVLLLALTGCTAEPQEPVQNTAEAPAEAVPSIDPGPIELTKGEAAERYLQLVCQGNVNIGNFRAAVQAGEDEFLAGGAPSADALKAAGAESVRLKRMQIEIIDDPYFRWPDPVSEQLIHIRSSSMAEVAADQSVMNAATFEEAYYVNYPVPTAEQETAAQEIRYQLGLDADTTGSCVGYEAALDEIHAEMLERNEQLAAQKEE
ncbi:hypothetical protein [Leucobacter sp. NPDC077196]|uniref:hypothetical protein n=1 Tax=Leucobacter sp. NPDC077196 TaxID=3154959 RepID=UPI00342768F8